MMAKRTFTAGELRDLLDRAVVVIEEGEDADEHGDLLTDLRDALTLVRRGIGGSRMGTGADVVLLQDDDDDDPDDDDPDDDDVEDDDDYDADIDEAYSRAGVARG
jgi:hypothetical protein